MKTAEFIFEIYCEEIPARHAGIARESLHTLFTELFERKRIYFDANRIACLSSSRRLVFHCAAVAIRQADEVAEIIGPPAKVARDSNGQFTQAALSFAKKYDVPASSLEEKETEKGRYVILQKISAGRLTSQVLAEELPSLIRAIDLNRRMYWTIPKEDNFTRPIRGLLAIFGGKPICFTYADVKAGAYTLGHVLRSAQPIRVRTYDEYLAKTRSAGTVVSQNERQKIILAGIRRICLKSNCSIIEDRSLLDVLVSSVEWPSVIAGKFDVRFLSLPREVLITVMREHQKYFAMQDKKGKLVNQFIAVVNNRAFDSKAVRIGHERVLKARFEDAAFFWESDLKTLLADRVPQLTQITFHEGLGTYFDKTQRLTLLAAHITGSFGIHVDEKLLQRACRLAKADLLTSMVKELPELQGRMGGIYSLQQGEPHELAEAIYDHYLPMTLEDGCPRNRLGTLISLVDKLDTLTGHFLLEHRPSGSADPFGLRRLGQGIVRLCFEEKLHINIKDCIKFSCDTYQGIANASLDRAVTDLYDFLSERARFVCRTLYSHRSDEADAVFHEEASSDFYDGLLKLQALSKLRRQEDFEPLATSFKRIKNIIDKSDVVRSELSHEVNEHLLAESAEIELFQSARSQIIRIEEGKKKRDYVNVLRHIAALRPRIDHFFDKVMVNVDSPELRTNRFNLIYIIFRELYSVADFSKLQSI